MTSIIDDLNKVKNTTNNLRNYYAVSEYTPKGEIIQVKGNGTDRPDFVVIHQDDLRNVLQLCEDNNIKLTPLAEFIPLRIIPRPIEYKPPNNNDYLRYTFRF